MSTAELQRKPDAWSGSRPAAGADRTAARMPAKFPPQRTERASGPYAIGSPGTAPAHGPYPGGADAGKPADRISANRLQLIDLMAIDVDNSGDSRAQLADRLGVTLPTVDSWLAETRRDRNIPLVAAPEWVKATGSPAVLEWAAREAGMWLGTEQDRLLRDYGAACLDESRARSRRERIEREALGDAVEEAA